MANPTLKLGATGDPVKLAQRGIARQLIPLKIDGIFGPKVEAEVKHLQSDAGVAATGIIDQPTWKLVFQNDSRHGAPSPLLKKGIANKSWVEALQLHIQGGDIGRVSKYGGKADGIFGPLTEAAIKRLQSDWKLVADGIVGDKTWFYFMAYPGVDGETLDRLVGQQLGLFP